LDNRVGKTGRFPKPGPNPTSLLPGAISPAEPVL
jgi:hypothetical protein